MDKLDLKREDLTFKDNSQLIPLAQDGNAEAMNLLIEVNIALVSTISKKFSNRGYEYEDIFQIGSMGLVKAIKKFDSNFNVKFSTYAVPMIIGEIKRFLRDDGLIKVSRSVKILAQKLHFDREALTKKLGREPTIEELSDFSKVCKEDVVFAMESSNNLNYLYDTIHHDDGAPVLLIDKLSEKSVEYEESSLINKIALKEALTGLDEKSRKIILLRYFKDRTQVEVSKLLGISQVQVSRIEKKVLIQMKERLREH